MWCVLLKFSPTLFKATKCVSNTCLLSRPCVTSPWVTQDHQSQLLSALQDASKRVPNLAPLPDNFQTKYYILILGLFPRLFMLSALEILAAFISVTDVRDDISTMAPIVGTPPYWAVCAHRASTLPGTALNILL